MVKLANILEFIKKQPLSILFFVVLTTSFFWHLSFRNRHFQECDSAGTYNMIYDFPKSALSYAALTYPEGNLLKPETVNKILENPTVKNQIEKYFSRYPKEQISERLSKLNIFAVLRFGYIQIVSSLNLPHQLLGFFAVPLGSTYSAGPGLMYTLITGSNTSYESFMSGVLFLNILVFHLSVLLLYFTAKKLKLSPLAAILPCLLMLFSISLYSTAFHTGSTLWNIASGILFLFFVAKYWNTEKQFKYISIISAILVFFNYLIAFYWLAFVLMYVSKTIAGQTLKLKPVFKALWGVIKKQKLAIFAFFICGTIFFQPGQSARGATSLNTLPSDLYYIVLNFFSFFNHTQSTIILEFILGAFIIIFVTKYVFSKTSAERENQTAVKNVLKWLFIIFWLLVFTKVLSLVPTRHILFLSPLWFLGLMLALEKYTARLRLFYALLIVVIISAFGFLGVLQRQLFVKDLTAQISLPKDIENIGVYDCSFNLVNKNWQNPVKIDFINPKNFEVGKTYLYLSQVETFDTALVQWQKNYNLDLEILNQTNQFNSTFFVAFNPNPKKFLYSRPNSLFETKFKVISIAPK
ncbi:MAG: hypothetical protein JNN11_04445 [Candidatus Doudnabacteria bacterium]|nr:hypothetical protein [Candidatus Doudnabacteria bacterium]